LNGPNTGVRTVTLYGVVPKVPSVPTTSTFSHGGWSRWNASGRPCQA
jgi:hypothetical protein